MRAIIAFAFITLIVNGAVSQHIEEPNTHETDIKKGKINPFLAILCAVGVVKSTNDIAGYLRTGNLGYLINLTSDGKLALEACTAMYNISKLNDECKSVIQPLLDDLKEISQAANNKDHQNLIERLNVIKGRFQDFTDSKAKIHEVCSH